MFTDTHLSVYADVRSRLEDEFRSRCEKFITRTRNRPYIENAMLVNDFSYLVKLGYVVKTQISGVWLEKAIASMLGLIPLKGRNYQGDAITSIGSIVEIKVSYMRPHNRAFNMVQLRPEDTIDRLVFLGADCSNGFDRFNYKLYDFPISSFYMKVAHYLSSAHGRSKGKMVGEKRLTIRANDYNLLKWMDSYSIISY